MKTRRRASIIGLLLALAVDVGFARSVLADDPHLGITEYEIACMPCHGVNGRGDGRLAKSLSKPPADLTQIAKSHEGKFPMQEVEEMIDGRAIVAAHGGRDMPVWGDRYRLPSMVRAPHGSNNEFAPKSGRSPITSNRFRKSNILDPHERRKNGSGQISGLCPLLAASWQF